MSNATESQPTCFCPHCLEENIYEKESGECHGCGSIIPEGIIDMAIENAEAKEMFSAILSIPFDDDTKDKLRTVFNERTNDDE